MMRFIAARLFAVLCTLGCLCIPLRSDAAEQNPNIHRRGGFAHALERFEKAKQGHVAFIGGSITEMNGYRPMVQSWLEKRFPDTKFTFTAAGISSTCSTTGAFRLQRDVLSKGPVDLFFIEFAVNDDQDAAHTRAECIHAMEGIVRQTKAHNPHADLVFTYFVNPGMLETITQGKSPLPIAAHETVADHYGVSTIHLAKEVAERIQAGTLTWKVYGGTHPKPPGNQIAADMIAQMLTEAWSKEQKPDASKLPEPLDAYHYGAGRFIDPSTAKAGAGWKFHTPNWKAIPGASRSRYVQQKLLCADKPGAALTLDFSGRAIGAFILAGPDAGQLEASIDGGDYRTINLYHHYSAGLNYPRTVMFADDLEPGEHQLQLRVSSEKPKASKGTAARILQFTAN